MSVGKTSALSGVLLVLSLVGTSARAAEDVSLARLATCQDSWLDWQKTDPAQWKKLRDHFGADFSHRDNDPFGVPKTNLSIGGLRITQAYPSSVGMGVGFSAIVAAPFDVARKAMEKMLAKPLGKCEASDGMKSCELQIADQRTVVVMSGDSPKASSTLVGCYYFYEK
jgi:hypothetical protein